MQDVILGNLLLFCSGVATEDFKAATRAKPVQDVIARSKAQVKKVFRIYAAGDRGSDARDDDMSEREFTRFCTEAKLLDEHTCTSVAVTQLFCKMQEMACDSPPSLRFCARWPS